MSTLRDRVEERLRPLPIGDGLLRLPLSEEARDVVDLLVGELETLRAELVVLLDHFNRNNLLLNDIATQVCCTHFERLPEAVRELVASLHAAETRALEDEQLRLRLAGDLAMEQRQHEMTRRRLEEAHREVDGLRAERASVDAGVCQSCSSAWWAREHDQNAAKKQVAAAEAARQAERARASAAQMATNAAVRDLVSMAGECERLRVKLAAAEAERDEAVTLLGEIREFARMKSHGPAVRDDLWAVKELADTFIMRNAPPPGVALAEVT